MLTISEQEVKNILKELSTKKSAGVDMIHPKLVKLAANYLARPLSQSINILLPLMRATTHAHASTRTTSLMHVKNSMHHSCL